MKTGRGAMNQRCTRRLIVFLYTTAILAIPVSYPAFSSASDATQHFTTGVRNSQSGNFEQSLIEWNKALHRYQKDGDLAGQIHTLQRRGESYLAIGHYPKALADFDLARVLAMQFGSRSLLASATVSLAAAYSLAGDPQQAEKQLIAAIENAEKSNEQDIAATARNNLANLLTTQQRYTEALVLYRQVLDQANAAGDNALASTAAINTARAHLDDDDLSRAQQTLGLALTMTRTLSPSHDKAYALISIGQLHARLANNGTNAAVNRRQAYETFIEATNTAQATGDKRALSYALGYTGEIYESLGKNHDALQLTQRALHQAQLLNAPELLYRWEWQTGRLLDAENDMSAAISAYQRAVYALQPIRHELTMHAVSGGSSFRNEMGALFLELAYLQLEYATSLTDPEEREHHLLGARETIEALKSAELEDYYQDDCVVALQKKTKGIDRLDNRVAAIYPIVFQDRLAILLSLPNGIKLFTTNVGARELSSTVIKFRQLLEKRTTHQYRLYAKKIHDWIIRPLEADLRTQHIETLVFVPDGVLRTIPLAALSDGHTFLIEKYAVATVPGLTLIDPRPIKSNQINVLVNGLTESVQGFPPLPEVKQELERIQELYNGKTLKNDLFQIGNFEAALSDKPYSIVHIASHGQFNSNVGETFVLTYESKMTMDALEKYMARTMYRENPVELITLSACQTAAGDDRAALGLAGIAIKAGARSALATLWYINDKASSMLISEFYRLLQDPSVSKAEALQRSQLMLLTDNRYKHPSYWSPFLLIGNWL
jgi:CHAT domain-containing protein